MIFMAIFMQLSVQVGLGDGQLLFGPYPLRPMGSTHANGLVLGAKGQVPLPLTLETASHDSLSNHRSTSLGPEKSLLHKTYKCASWIKQSLKTSEKSCMHSYSVTASVHGPFTRRESE